MANALARLLGLGGDRDTLPAAKNTIQLRKLYQQVLENPGPEDLDERGEVIQFHDWVRRQAPGTNMIVAQ